MQGLDALAVAAIIEKALADYALDLTSGSLVTVNRNKSTCHKLPIGGLRSIDTRGSEGLTK